MIGFISDIHGNYPALHAVINKLETIGCESIICLGDVAGYYCMINECIELLRERNIICLKGNHDSYLLGESQCPRSRSANDCIKYQQKIITEENLKWIKNLEKIITTPDFCAVHGGWHDYLDEYIIDFNFKDVELKRYNTKVFLSGHTHKQVLQIENGVQYCNPGSVGQPRDYDSSAGYAVLENGNISIDRLAYDIDEIANKMNIAGFDEYYYRNLYYGCKIGEQIND